MSAGPVGEKGIYWKCVCLSAGEAEREWRREAGVFFFIALRLVFLSSGRSFSGSFFFAHL